MKSLPISQEEARKFLILVIDGKLEEALELFSRAFGIRCPSYKVGLPSGHYKAYACYDSKRNMICFKDRVAMRNPFIVLHELYHALRSKSGRHKGTERKADEFAEKFIIYALKGRYP